MHIVGLSAAKSHVSTYSSFTTPVIPAKLSQCLDASQDDDDEQREFRDKDETPSTANRFPYPSEYGAEFVASAGMLVILLLVGHCHRTLSPHRANAHDKDTKTLHTKLVDSYALGLLAYANFESPSIAAACLWVSMLGAGGSDGSGHGSVSVASRQLWRLGSRLRCDFSLVPYASEFKSNRICENRESQTLECPRTVLLNILQSLGSDAGATPKPNLALK